MCAREVRRVITPTFYMCPTGAADCALDNQESRLEIPFKAWKKNKDATYIIVTDLFMSSKHLVAGRRQQLVQPIKSILRKGKAVAIIGVMSSFNGVIYDIPLSAGGTTSYSKAQQRPFYIIIIGEQKNIHKIKKTIEQLNTHQVHLLIDGNDFKPFAYIKDDMIEHYPHTTIKSGDNTYTSIAAASILAKTSRDAYITELCETYPYLEEQYGIACNKGYGAKRHMDGIREYGITKWHRKTFGLCKTAKTNTL